MSSLKTHYGHAARQLYRVMERVDAAPELAELRGRTLYSLIVFLDPINTVNSPLFAELRAEAKRAERVPSAFEPQIASVGAIEWLAPSVADHSLAGIYQAKITNADHASWDWDTYVLRHLPHREHPLLVDTFDRFTAPIERSS